MTRRVPLKAIAMLVATLPWILHPAPALADRDQGRDQRYGEKNGHGRSDEQAQAGNDNRGKGQGDSRGRGNSDERRQDRDDYRGNAEGNRGNGRQTQQRQALSPQGAAQQARSKYGGQVLKVQPAGRGYQVRLLQDDGRVVTVPITD